VERWLDPEVDEPAIKTIVDQELNNLKQAVMPKLSQRQGADESLESLIRSACRPTPEHLALPVSRLRDLLQNYPTPDSRIPDRFDESGDYFSYVQTQFRMVVAPACREAARRLYYRCRENPALSLVEVSAALERMKRRATARMDELERYAARFTFEFASLDPYLKRMARIEKDVWLKSLGLRRQALKERKDELFAIYQRMALRAMQALVSQFERDALGVLVAEIESIGESIAAVVDRLRACYAPNNRTGQLRAAEKQIVERLGRVPRNMHYVFPTPQNDGQREMEIQRERVQREEAVKALFSLPEETEKDADAPQGVRLDHWIAERPTTRDLAQRFLDALVLVVLRNMEPPNIMDEVLRNWQAYRDTVKFSSPYVELNESYFGDGGRLTPPGRENRNEVFAPESIDRLTQDLAPMLPILGSQQGGRWSMNSLRQLSHYMIFYCEEPYFTTTYMRAFPAYEKAFRDPGGTVNPVLKWTDKRHSPDGPDLDLLGRASYIGLLLEHSLGILAGTNENDKLAGMAPLADLSEQLFRIDRRGRTATAFFEMKREGGFPESLRVGDLRDYRRVAEAPIAREFIPQLVDSLVDVVRELGPTPAASQAALTERCGLLTRRLNDRRLELEQGRGLDEATERSHRQKLRRIEAFFVHVKYLAWGEMPNPETKRSVLSVDPWIIDWASEKY
jgi:hypothetical protein